MAGDQNFWYYIISVCYIKSALCLCEQTCHQKCCNNWFHRTQKAIAARPRAGLGRNKVGQSFLWRPVRLAVCLTISLKCFCSSVGGNLLLGLVYCLKMQFGFVFLRTVLEVFFPLFPPNTIYILKYQAIRSLY